MRCGLCKTIFPLNLHSYELRCTCSDKIVCPSCLVSPPCFISEIVKELLVNKDNFDGWEVGLKFDTQQCKLQALLSNSLHK